MRAVSARPFVGRDRELHELEQALQGARIGSARLVFLRGEPGIGETRLCEELSDRAQAEGFAVAWGRCWETPGAPPYWPWRQLYDELQLDTPELRALLEGDAAPSPAEANRARVHQLTVSALRDRARKRPLLLVFEDLHAADLPTVTLLTFAARTLKRSAVLWLVTARDRDLRLSAELQGLLSKLSREGVPLEPLRLTPPAVAQLARLMLDRPLDDDAVDAVVKATEGTPLYVDGTLRLIGTHQPLKPLPLPQSARDVLRDRLDLMPPASRELLELASVIGRTFSRPLLAAATGGAHRDVDDALAPAVKAGLLREVSHDELGFAHALLREALYQGLNPRRRPRLHHLVKIALQEREAPADELAHHALAALPLGSTDDAVALAVKAARHAAGLLAFDRAAELYERALQTVAAEGDTARRADLLVALAHACLGAGRHQAAIAAAERAASVARILGDAERLAAAALASGSVFRLGAVDRALVSLLEEAFAALGSDHPYLAVRVKARLASALQPALDPAGPVRLAEEAIEQARALGDPQTLLHALHFGLSAMGDLTDATERAPYLRELVALAAQQKDEVLLHRAQARLAMCLWELGDVGGASAAVAEVDRLGNRLGDSWRLRALLFHSLRAQLEGRFDDADRIAAETSRAGEDTDSPELLKSLGIHGSVRLVLQCRFDELAKAADELTRAIAGPATQEHGIESVCGAYVWALCGDVDRARGYLERVPPSLLSYPDRGILFWAATAAGLLGDVERCQALEPVLRAVKQPFVGGGLMGMTLDGPMAWPRGLVAAALDKRDEALALLDLARRQCLAVGARPLAVRVLADRDRIAGTREHAAEIEREARAMRLPSLLSLTPSPLENRPPDAPLTLRRDGELWLLVHGSTTLRLKDSRGVQMLSTLLAHPGREFHVLELSGSDASADTDAGEVLDATAKAEYRARLEALRDELEEAGRFNDSGRAAKAQEELDFLLGELAAGVGLGGRLRKASSNAERARVNVQRRLKDALQRIEEQAPELGRRLTRAVRTGTFCAFENL